MEPSRRCQVFPLRIPLEAMKPSVYAGLREPTAVNLAAFARLCQQQKPLFPQLFSVFSGFFWFLAYFQHESDMRESANALHRSLETHSFSPKPFLEVLFCDSEHLGSFAAGRYSRAVLKRPATEARSH
jgi:hypothetical protein